MTTSIGDGYFRPQQLDSCKVVSLANLSAVYSNGANGIDATLTSTSLGALTIDGILLQFGQRVLINGQSSTFQNGIYYLSTVGGSIEQWVLTRTNDLQSIANVRAGAFLTVADGSVNAGTIWVLVNPLPTAIGVTPYLFVENSAASTEFATKSIVYVDHIYGSDTTGNGSIAKPYQTITYTLAHLPATPTLAAPVILQLAPSENYDDNFSLPANVFIIGYGELNTFLTGTIDINDSSWNVAGNLISGFQGVSLPSITFDFTLWASSTVGSIRLENVRGLTSTITFKAQSNGNSIFIRNADLLNSFVQIGGISGLLVSVIGSMTYNDSASRQFTSYIAGGSVGFSGGTNTLVANAVSHASTLSISGVTFPGATWNVSGALLTVTADSAAIPLAANLTIGAGVTFTRASDSGSWIAPPTAGKIARSNGTILTASTSTFADTYSASTILYSNGANTITGLATANNGTLVTSGAGVPSILAGPGTTGQILQSNAAAAPSFSTASYPSTTTVSQILYSSSSNTVAGLATANSASLVTNSTGVPAWSGTMTNGQLIVGSTGATPTAATLTAGTGIAITNGAGTIGIATSGVVTEVNVTGTSQTIAVNTGYISNNAGLTTFTIPTTAAVGDRFEIHGSGAGGWITAQAASQILHVGSTADTTGATGTVASSNRYDSVSFICIVANLEFTSYAVQGNLTVV